MAWRYTGRARVNPRHPEAFGICDRCGFLYNLVDLLYQWDWRGPRLANLRLRVCGRCMDRPSNAFRTIIYPPDPVPVTDPRLPNYQIANNGSPFTPPLPWPVQTLGPVVIQGLLDADGNILVDEDGNMLIQNPAPPLPVYVTPPLPPLPQEIESEP